MNITAGTIYIVTRLDAVHGILSLLLALAMAVSLWLVYCKLAAGTLLDDPKLGNKVARPLHLACTLLVVLALLKALIPTQQEYVAMTAIPAVCNNETVRTDLKLIHDAVVQFIESKTEKEE